MKENDTNYYGNEAFETIYQRMKEQYAPEKINYTPLDEQTLAERISKVLRPVYEKAISALFRGNKRQDAELDADAISRGMGSSTFVTDVKRRQDNLTTEGVRDLETEYGAKLADQLYKAMEGERDRQLEVDKFNAQQQSAALSQAFEATKVLYEAYLTAKKRHGGGGGKAKQDKQDAEGIKESLAESVAAARGQLKGSPNGPAFYAYGERETVDRTLNSDLPQYVKLRRQMNGDFSAGELRRARQVHMK
ncbi:MAG: hypothetical protein IJO66_03335 [Clostridia bacterium]|nr:hypothetical protein [Clostridia bacterium]MBR0206823.1 hypothetical protein [Clostridia bacterium]